LRRMVMLQTPNSSVSSSSPNGPSTGIVGNLLNVFVKLVEIVVPFPITMPVFGLGVIPQA